MASLKEVKSRISSVKTTRKITQARQMVASAQLHRTQALLESARAYRNGLEAIRLEAPLLESPFYEEGKGDVTAVVILSSNSGMCGGFNSRMQRELPAIQKAHKKVLFYPIGTKIRKALCEAGLDTEGNYDALSEKASVDEVAQVAAELTAGFLAGKFNRVEVIYYCFHHISSQKIAHETLLPLCPPCKEVNPDAFIVEPSPEALLGVMLPMAVNAHLYACLVSNRASEHAARMVAMRLATENANDLLDELQLSYNKLRQQNITSELLDIIGGSFA